MKHYYQNPKNLDLLIVDSDLAEPKITAIERIRNVDASAIASMESMEDKKSGPRKCATCGKIGHRADSCKQGDSDGLLPLKLTKSTDIDDEKESEEK